MIHRPVLLNEAIKFLDPKPGETVVDSTVGGGGHGMAILEKILPNGRLIGIDQDQTLLDELNSKSLKNTILIHGNFRNIDSLLRSAEIEKIDAVLFDLGISSYHLDISGRGFSFKKDEPVLMNLKYPLSAGGLTAEDILNHWEEERLAEIIKEFGEERYAGRIAKAIVGKRPIKSTGDLVKVIEDVIPPYYRRGRLHFATRTFQALRIVVNDELIALREAISNVWHFLKPRGRLVVISFHSLEDRIVKNFFKEKAGAGEAEILTKKPVTPSLDEIKENPKSRSAKLRAITKI